MHFLIFDYQYLTEDSYIEVLIEKRDGEEWLLEIDKEPDEDLGLEFESGLMDDYHSCSNKCIFCFIDQMPPGMRETLYFKDDDSRLSFLQGNYVTLTNMSDHDINRIIKYRLSPINISFQTTNPELRCMMLHNRFAGEALKKVDLLYEAEIEMNGQIVLCKGVNDGAQLERTLNDLERYAPHLRSVSVVPVGLSKYREGLYPLEPFTKEDAKEILQTIHSHQEKMVKKHGLHFIHASDEIYLLAGEELPEAESYDDYLQLENGVGMLRLLLDEFEEACQSKSDVLNGIKKGQTVIGGQLNRGYESSNGADGNVSEYKEISMVTGMLAYPYILRMTERIQELYPHIKVHLYPIINFFFGENITVSGLLTGQDIIHQLRGKQLGERLLLPINLLRSGEKVLLDDVTTQDIEKALQVPIDIVKSSGWDFLDAVTSVHSVDVHEADD